ncbi:hypothetical protein MKW94_010544 [Papaver nudicaule]|uniref:EF-hand domain-containing protein n=1 Tax=Papaver nudicaule TaxID=74823 RepID=A0AA41SEY1_PAPNU|nr:hypothetical protein [Papaver nudicaule]
MCPSNVNSRPKSETVSESDFRPAFDVLDTDRDGKISVDDLKTFYSGFHRTASDEEISSMISIADSNKNGFVEIDEFEKVVMGGNGMNSRNPSTSSSASLMNEVFKIMDKDGDGKVGFEDLKDYMKCAGLFTSDDDIKAMIKLGGGDETQGVSFEGLLDILAV